jgi:hypothetical protein
MSRVFQNIDPPPPSLPGECAVCTPRLCCGGRTHSPGGDIGLPSYSNNLSTGPHQPPPQPTRAEKLTAPAPTNPLSTVGAVSFSALVGGWEEGLIGAMSDVHVW